MLLLTVLQYIHLLVLLKLILKALKLHVLLRELLSTPNGIALCRTTTWRAPMTSSERAHRNLVTLNSLINGSCSRNSSRCRHQLMRCCQLLLGGGNLHAHLVRWVGSRVQRRSIYGRADRAAASRQTSYLRHLRARMRLRGRLWQTSRHNTLARDTLHPNIGSGTWHPVRYCI